MTTKTYFAYGMNLNHKHMALACPTAVPIGPKKIYGYRRAFRQFADIEKSNDTDYIWGGVWQIDEEAEEMLDYIENFPFLYKKIEIDGMLTYQMTDENYPSIRPSDSYLEMIREGLVNFGLSKEILEQNLRSDLEYYG